MIGTTRCRILLLRGLLWGGTGLAWAMAGGAGAWAQTVEVEPNHPCAAAQNVAAPDGALILTGRRDGGDVDFFRLSGPPGALLVADLQGAGAGAGTLGDGVLGAFSADCASLLDVDDDSGVGFDPRLVVRIPPSGSLVLAASSFSDFDFDGDGGSTGTYRLRTSAVQVTGELSGRLMDQETGQPVRFADLVLTQCAGDTCSFPSTSASTDADGRFRIHSDSFFLMFGGLYELSAFHPSYQQTSRLIEIHGKTDMDIGDISLAPLPALSSIRGRLVDLATGQPLRGDAPPFAQVQLHFCDAGSGSFCGFVSSRTPDADGSFLFTGHEFDPLEEGTYRIVLNADQYVRDLGDTFTAADGQDLDLGDVPARSFPVRVAEVESCGTIPAGGGRCRFTVGVSNGQATALQARGWIAVSSFFTGSFGGSSWFQLTPRLIDLPPGGSTVLPFTLDVPGTVPNGALFCGSFYAAAKDRPLEPFAVSHLFCIQKSFSGFQRVPHHDLQRILATGGGPAPRP